MTDSIILSITFRPDHFGSEGCERYVFTLESLTSIKIVFKKVSTLPRSASLEVCWTTGRAQISRSDAVLGILKSLHDQLSGNVHPLSFRWRDIVVRERKAVVDFLEGD